MANTSANNQAYVQELVYKTRQATEQGMRRAVLFVQGEAQKNAVDRIYQHPVPLKKDGRPLYVRTGLYKSSIKGTVTSAYGYVIEGQIESPVAYAKYLEYKCQKMCITDAIFNNEAKIMEFIKGEITSIT